MVVGGGGSFGRRSQTRFVGTNACHVKSGDLLYERLLPFPTLILVWTLDIVYGKQVPHETKQNKERGLQIHFLFFFFFTKYKLDLA